MPKCLKFTQYTAYDPITETFIPNDTGLGPTPVRRKLAHLSTANPRLFNTRRAATSAILQYRRFNPDAPELQIKPAYVGISIS